MSDPVVRYETRFNLFALLAAGVWLLFLAPAVQEGWDERGAVVGWVGLMSILAFSAVYVWSFIWARPMRRTGALWRRVDLGAATIIGVLVVLGVMMTLTVHSSGLGAAVYISVAGVTLLPMRYSIPLAIVLAALTETLARTVPGWDGADGIALSVVLATFAVWGIWVAMRRSADLVAAQEENSRLTIGEERARMARDLHDILGHSLTVIAIKAELADRLVDVSPKRARAEIADIQRLSRDALADVRRTVDGVRELSLPGEIIRARAALQAAEIVADLPGTTDEVSTENREVFAWALREGVTNVVRHSCAARCTVTLASDQITIADDGRGMPDATVVAIRDGHGLSGLRERAGAAGAHVVVDAPAGGGFRLTLRIGQPVAGSPEEASPLREPSIETRRFARPSRPVQGTKGTESTESTESTEGTEGTESTQSVDQGVR